VVIGAPTDLAGHWTTDGVLIAADNADPVWTSMCLSGTSQAALNGSSKRPQLRQLLSLRSSCLTVHSTWPPLDVLAASN